MNILELICLIISGASVVFCSVKGLKRSAFKISAFVVVIIFAKGIGKRFGYFLLSDIIYKKIADMDVGVSESTGNTLVSAFGTLTVFILLLFILKRIFALVEGKMKPSLQYVITERILGAAELFKNPSFVLTFTPIVMVNLTSVTFEKKDIGIVNNIDSSINIKYSRNLN